MIRGASSPVDSPRAHRPRLTPPGGGARSCALPYAAGMAQLAVSGSAVELTADVDPGDRSYSIAISPTVDLFVELFPEVTAAGATTGGFRIPAGGTLTADLTSGERLWGVTTGAAGTAYVLRTGLA